MMLSNRAIAMLGAVLATSSVEAQSPQIIRFDGGHSDEAAALAVDAAGNFIVAATVNDASQPSPIALLKYDAAGRLVWRAHFSGSSAGAPTALATDASGNVYVGGYVYSNVVVLNPSVDWLVAKFDASGAQLWSHTFNGAANGGDRVNQLLVDRAGNVYAGGVSAASDGFDWRIVKYSPTGQILWERREGRLGTVNNNLLEMAVDANGNVVVTGTVGATTPVVGPFAFDIRTVKFNSAGATLWAADFTDSPNSIEFPSDVAIDSRGRIYVTGTTNINTTGEVPTVPVTLIYDDAGSLQRILRGMEAGGEAVSIDAVDNVFLVGATDGVSAAEFFPDFRIQASAVKLDALGNRLWLTDLTQTDRFLPSLLAHGRRGLFASGPVIVPNADYFTMKLDEDSGALLFTHRLNGPTDGHDRPVASAPDAFGNVLVTGTTQGRLGSAFNDVVTLKFSDGAAPPPPPTLPAPSQLSARAISSRQIALGWLDNSTNETSFSIERCRGGACVNFVAIAEVGANVTALVDGGLSRGVTYRYRVRALSSAAASTYSNIASATTPRR